jgi:purine-nucleoside phosphorylase
VADSLIIRAVRVIAARTRLRPRLAIWLGSAFGGVVDGLEVEARIPYAAIPGFARPTVPGHAGEVIFGRLASLPVCLLAGRAHYYEGHDLATVTFPVRVLARLGIQDLLLTNAAGGIRADLRPGDFMLLRDHINAMGVNPLRGQTGGGSDGFVDLCAVYDGELSRLLSQAARQRQVRLRRGVYLAVSGPSYETPAEIRAFARWGADAVGMSTVPEAIVARQCGLRVVGLSCITNLAAGRTRRPISHEEVLVAGLRATERAHRLLAGFVRLYARNEPSRVLP